MTKKTISELRLQDDSITRNGTVILEQIENYHRNLYTSDLIFSETAYDTFTDIVESPKLSEDVQETWEPPLSYEECKKILETFRNNKEDRSLLDLSNWRLITLPNVDLKIASKAIAKRIEPTPPNLIHSDQTSL